MGSGSLGLSIGRSALQAQQTALEVTSQNLANANTEGYARKTVSLQSAASINLPDVQGPVYASQIGTGVMVGRIESVRDLLLNQRIRNLESDHTMNEEMESVLDQVEALFTGEIDLARSLDDFFSALNDLAAAPDSLTVRSVVRARGVEVADMIRAAADGVETIRVNLADQVADKAAKINTITAELAETNERIAAMVSANLQPNDFEDRRQVLLEQLAEYADVQTVDGAASTMTVLLGGQVVVAGTQSVEVQVVNNPADDQLPQLATGDTPDLVLAPRTGLLAAWQDLSDGPLDRLYGDLNELTVSLATSFNTIHRAGFGLDNSTGTDFFDIGDPPTSETRLYAVTGTGYVPETDVALDGDSTTAQPENFETNPIGQGSFVVNGRSIAYNGATDSLEDLVDRINAAGANVWATITPENRLQLAATSDADYTITNLADSGGALLARLGILPANSSYPPSNGVTPPTSVLSGDVTLRPPDDAASRIAVTAEILGNLNRIAAALGDDLTAPPDGTGDQSRGPGDGANALNLAQLRTGMIMTGGTATLHDFFTASLGELGVEAGVAQRTAEGLDAQILQLKNRREEVQGVSIDEELINMIKYQRGFEAASRIITVMDEVLQTLLALGR